MELVGPKEPAWLVDDRSVPFRDAFGSVVTEDDLKDAIASWAGDVRIRT